MSKKTILLIIIFILIVSGALFYFIYFNNKTQSVVETVKNYLPFGTPAVQRPVNNQPKITTDNSNIPVEIDLSTAPVPVLRQITNKPVAGFTSFTTEKIEIIDGKKYRSYEHPIRYIEQATGNVYETKTNSLVLNRITRSTLPKITSAYFLNSGTNVLAQSIGDADSIISYVGKINPIDSSSTSQSGKIDGSYNKDISDSVTISPNTNNIFTLQENINGALGLILNTGGNKNSIFSSEISEWLPQWFSSSTIAITSKPSSGVPGSLFYLNINNGKLSKIIGGISGLTTLVSPDGNKVLYSTSNNGSTGLVFIDIEKNISININKSGLPEKCAWAINSSEIYCFIPDISSGLLPDDWYKGLVSFNDSIWKISNNGNTVSVVYNLSDKNIDGINPKISDDGKYLLFMNKKDNTLWSAQIDLSADPAPTLITDTPVKKAPATKNTTIKKR